MERIDPQAGLNEIKQQPRKPSDDCRATLDNPENKQIVRALTLLAELQKHDLSSDQLMVWIGYLSRYDINDVRKAVNLWCENNKFFPMPSELIGLIKDSIAQRRRKTIQIPDNLRSFDEQAEINRKGISAVRAALRGHGHKRA